MVLKRMGLTWLTKRKISGNMKELKLSKVEIKKAVELTKIITDMRARKNDKLAKALFKSHLETLLVEWGDPPAAVGKSPDYTVAAHWLGAAVAASE